MIAGYPGPRLRRPPGAALELPPRRWGYMHKIDGACVRIRLDGHGRIASTLSRAGRELPEGRELHGIVAGPPDSILWAELECHTEAGIRAAATRGYRVAWLWDAERWDGRDLRGEPFATRYAALHQGHAMIEGDGAGRVRSWLSDQRGRAHDPTSGRYTRAIPRDLRRVPVVTLHRGPGAGTAAWQEHVVRGGGEGLVAARLDAPIGARAAKIKIRDGADLDALVVQASGGAACLHWRGVTFTVSARGRWASLTPGQIVTVVIDGWHERTTTPKHPRITRIRTDLAPPTAPGLECQP